MKLLKRYFEASKNWIILIEKWEQILEKVGMILGKLSEICWWMRNSNEWFGIEWQGFWEAPIKELNWETSDIEKDKDMLSQATDKHHNNQVHRVSLENFENPHFFISKIVET